MKFDESLLYNIKSDYQGIRYSLFDLAIWKNGLAFKKINFSDRGLPVIKIAELNNGISSNTSLTQGDYGKEVFVQWDDLLFSWSGNPQTSIDVFRYRLPDGWLNQHIFKVTANSNLVTKDFLYYTLKYLKPYFTQIATNKQTTGLGHVTIADLKRMSVVIPQKEIQEQITSILKAIDDKIEVNSNINENLEQQAQAIFKSWFVDFEPFSNQRPSNWSVSTLGNISIMGAGGDKPQNVSPIKSNLYQYPIYSNGLSDEGLYGFTDKPKIFKESVTVSARGTIGFVCLRHIPYVPIVRLVTLIPKIEFISAKYLYLWLKQLHITGTGTTQQQLTVPDFRKTEILVPSQEIVTLFTDTVEPIFEKIWANQSENEKLSSLRDTLLPKLMSGELDVSVIDL